MISHYYKSYPFAYMFLTFQFKRELIAKAAGMEFISPAQLQERLKHDSESSGGDRSSNSDDESVDDSEEETDESSDEGDDHQSKTVIDLNPDKKGIEIELRHLQLRENASALLFDKLKVIVQCLRCKNHADLMVHQEKVCNVWKDPYLIGTTPSL